MSEITLEKVDIIRERTGVNYSESKEALENCNGDVVGALIYLENKSKAEKNNEHTSKDEFINWVKELVKKGNVTRIKIKKDEKVLVDIPVSAGIAVTSVIYLISEPLLAVGVFTAVVAKVTVEITKADGSVEVVNKVVENTFSGVKEKFINITEDLKEKFSCVSEEVKEKFSAKNKTSECDTNVYKYTVKFDENDEENDKNNME